MTEALRLDPLIHAAHMAGQGATAEEIAAAVGARSAEAITEALRLYNIRLEAKPFGARVIPVRVSAATHAPLKAASSVRSIDVTELSARILATVARDISIDGLLDDGCAGE